MTSNIIHEKVSIFGDLHGKYKEFHQLANKNKSDYILQIGDCGFSYEELNKYDSNKIKFIPGNHENYDLCFDSPYCLGNWGQYKLGPLEFFYIRGAYSVDVAYRTAGISWWDQEQLSVIEMDKAFEEYCKTKPKVVITHTCPRVIADIIGDPRFLIQLGYDPVNFTTDTQELLQACFDVHKPETHIFGHFHRNLDFHYQGTRFICLDELCSLEYQDDHFINSNKVEKV